MSPREKELAGGDPGGDPGGNRGVQDKTHFHHRLFEAGVAHYKEK